MIAYVQGCLFFCRSLADALQERSRYRLALLVYAVMLALLAMYSGVRLYRRYRALETQCEQQTLELSEARSRLGGLEEDAIIVEDYSHPVARNQKVAV